ncbi:MAG TPA: hypothetical protein VGF48_20635 [Thermoanaerobaculia bacterium]|jgi:hypothetical protein
MRRRGQRGIALIAAIVLAMLYFGLIQLLLIDSQRDLREAQRFRSRVTALTLAENGVELAAVDLVNRSGGFVDEEDWQGTYSGRRQGGSGSTAANIQPFLLIGEAETKGTVKVRSKVQVFGEIVDEGTALKRVKINYTMHSQ